RLADQAQRADVQRLAGAGAGGRQPPCRAERAHEPAAGSIDIAMTGGKVFPTPDRKPRREVAVARFEEGPVKECRVAHLFILVQVSRGSGGGAPGLPLSCPRTPVSPWPRRRGRRVRSPSSACTTPAPAPRTRSPGPAPCSIPGSTGSW